MPAPPFSPPRASSPRRRWQWQWQWLLTALPLLLLLLPWTLRTRSHSDSVSPPRLRVTFLDVGQGDAAVIECPSGKVVVIDGGGIPGTDETWGGDPGSRVVVPYLRSRGSRQWICWLPRTPTMTMPRG